MKHWYVIQTKPKKEETVSRQLAQAECEVFVPKMKSLTSTKPLFPSYAFVRTDLQDPSRIRMVQFTRGVRKILGDGIDPQPISDAIVETLREKADGSSLLEQETLFRDGDQVRVKKGILRDLVGIIEKNLPEKGRIKILFKWLRHDMRAVLKYTELERIS